MKIKRKGSLIFISMLFILILSIGIASASEDVDTEINNNYQSDSININATIDEDNGNYNELKSVETNDIETIEKSKGNLYADGDDSVEEPEPEEPVDPLEKEYYIGMIISEPENESYVEGEPITINLTVTDEYDEPTVLDCYLNLYNLQEDESGNYLFDKYYHIVINKTLSFTIPDYLAPSTQGYGMQFAVTNEEDEGFIIPDNIWLWNFGGEDILEEPEIIVKTNYNKEVNATLTIGYNIIETYNLTEGDSIKGSVRVIDEFGNKLSGDKVTAILYKWDEEEGEYVEDNSDTGIISNGMAGPFSFDDLKVGTYYLIVEMIEHNDEFSGNMTPYTNINTKRINFTVKPDPKKYMLNVSPETDAKITDDTYEFKLQILDPYGNPIEGIVEAYNNEEKIDEINVIYENEDYFTYNINNLNLGINNLTFIYKVNEETNKSVSLQITKYASKSKININAPSITLGEDALIKVNMTDDDGKVISEKITLIISKENGEFHKEFNITGNGEITIAGNELEIGVYNIEAIFDGVDYEYYNSQAECEFEVLDESLIEANLELSRLDENNVLVKLTDLDSNPIGNKNIKINVNGAVSTVTTDENGSYIIPISGNSTIKAIYVNPINKGVLVSALEVIYDKQIIEKNNTIIVNNTVEVPVNATISLSTEDGRKVIAKLTDLDGKAIAGANIKLTINGEQSDMTTGTDGTTIIFVNGNNTITASYTTASNNTISSSIRTTVITNEIIKEINNTIIINNTIKRAGTIINYNDMKTVAVNTASDGRVGEYFNITLTDIGGNPLANKEIKIGFNGKIYNRTTDAKGFAKLQINLAREDIYTFAVAFLGDDEYNASFVVAKINVTKQSPKLTTANKSYKASAKTKTLTATFKTALGNPIKSKKISFTVNGKTYTGTTNKNGVVSVNVSLSKKGTYSFTVKYAGDDTFKTVSKTGKLTIS